MQHRLAFAAYLSFSFQPFFPKVRLGRLQVRRMATMDSPSAERNKQPILEQMKLVLPKARPLNVLEVACGCGVHATNLSGGLVDAGFEVRISRERARPLEARKIAM